MPIMPGGKSRVPAWLHDDLANVLPHQHYIPGLRSKLIFYDDFLGNAYNNRTWGGTATVKTLLDLVEGGVLRIGTSATSGSTAYNDWASARSLLVSKNVLMEAKCRAVQSTYIYIEIGLNYDGSNRIMFYADESSGGSATWKAFSQSAGASTAVDTGVALDTGWHIFRIECSSTAVKFYIDEVLVATVTTNIPTLHLSPRFLVMAKENAEKDLDTDYVFIMEDR
jgi:hypothetical protein